MHNNRMDYKTISFIIATCNRQDDLRDCLRSITQLDYPQEYIEVNVIDNEGSPETKRIAASFGYRYFHEKVKGISAVRNRGVAEARNEYIAFIDDDAVVTSSWVQEILPYLHENTLVTGKIYVAGTSRYVRGCGPRYATFLGGSIGLPDRFSFLSNTIRGGNMIIPRKVFDTIGRFKDGLDYGFEESYFAIAARRHGFTVTYVQGGLVYHKGDPEKTGVKLRSANKSLIATMRAHYADSIFKEWSFIILITLVKIIQAAGYLLKKRSSDAHMVLLGLKDGLQQHNRKVS